MLELAGQVGAIILIDLVLSGDNALVIGSAARSLPPESRKRAILLGGLGAVGLRILFTAMAAILLDIPLLQAVGGVVLIWIAFKLVRPAKHDHQVSESDSLQDAVKTIILADVVMSLDNILAVGGAAHGNLWLLLFGLALSIPILLMGSAGVAWLMGRFPALVYFGSIVLIITAVRMFFHDDWVHDIYAAASWEVALVAAVISVGVVFFGLKSGTKLMSATSTKLDRTVSQPGQNP